MIVKRIETFGRCARSRPFPVSRAMQSPMDQWKKAIYASGRTEMPVFLPSLSCAHYGKVKQLNSTTVPLRCGGMCRLTSRDHLQGSGVYWSQALRAAETGKNTSNENHE